MVDGRPSPAADATSNVEAVPLTAGCVEFEGGDMRTSVAASALLVVVMVSVVLCGDGVAATGDPWVEQQKLTVNSGVWPLYRFDPRRIQEGKAPLELDSRDPTVGVREYLQNESRFRMIEAFDRERFERLVAAHQRETTRRFAVYKQLAGITFPQEVREEESASSSSVEARAS